MRESGFELTIAFLLFWDSKAERWFRVLAEEVNPVFCVPVVGFWALVIKSKPDR